MNDPVFGPIMKARDEGHFLDAEKLLKSAVQNAESQTPPDPRLRVLLSQLTGIELQLGHPDQAVAVQERMLANDESVFGKESPQVAGDLASLGHFFWLNGDLDSAIKTLEHALAVARSSKGPMLLILGNLASFYREAHRNDDAEALLIEAVKFCDAYPGPHLPNCSGLRAELANLNREEGHASYADEIIARGAERSAEAKADWFTRVSDLNTLGRQQEEEQNFAVAEETYRQAIAIIQNAPELKGKPGNDAGELGNLGRLYEKEGRSMEAEEMYKRALESAESGISPERAQAAGFLMADVRPLVDLYRSQGRFAESEPILTQALAIQEKFLGADHFKLVNTLQELARVYEDEENFAAAEPLYLRVISLLEKSAGPDNPQLLTPLIIYSRLLRKMDQSAKAVQIEARLTALRQKLQRPATISASQH